VHHYTPLTIVCLCLIYILPWNRWKQQVGFPSIFLSLGWWNPVLSASRCVSNTPVCLLYAGGPLESLQYVNNFLALGSKSVHSTLHMVSQVQGRKKIASLDLLSIVLLTSISMQLVFISTRSMCFLQIKFLSTWDLSSFSVKLLSIISVPTCTAAYHSCLWCTSWSSYLLIPPDCQGTSE